MCFSAEVSFGAAALLAVAGIAAVKRNAKPSQALFAAIPLLFSLQQLSEGFVWLSMTNPGYSPYHNLFAYVFLVFAQLIWPFYTPLAIAMVEKKSIRKKIILALTAIGVLLSLIYAQRLFTYGVEVEATAKHIKYCVNCSPDIFEYRTMLYLAVTILPAFISTSPKIKLFGLLIMSSLAFTELMYAEYVLSVWCFFSALISAVIYYLVKEDISDNPDFKKLVASYIEELRHR